MGVEVGQPSTQQQVIVESLLTQREGQNYQHKQDMQMQMAANRPQSNPDMTHLVRGWQLVCSKRTNEGILQIGAENTPRHTMTPMTAKS